MPVLKMNLIYTPLKEQIDHECYQKLLNVIQTTARESFTNDLQISLNINSIYR